MWRRWFSRKRSKINKSELFVSPDHWRQLPLLPDAKNLTPPIRVGLEHGPIEVPVAASPPYLRT